MAFEILRDLRGLRVEVMLPPDAESIGLVEHLRRIGCIAASIWPPPGGERDRPDLVILEVDFDRRDRLRDVCRVHEAVRPTVIAVVGYENPSTLQLVLESGAHAVIERPVRPFGLLTQLVVARASWKLQSDLNARLRKLERKLAGQQNVARARLMLMARLKLTENQAYKAIRDEAMARRIALEEVALSIIERIERVAEPCASE